MLLMSVALVTNAPGKTMLLTAENECHIHIHTRVETELGQPGLCGSPGLCNQDWFLLEYKWYM